MIWSRARVLHKSGTHPPYWYLASKKSLRLTDIVNPMLVELSSCYFFTEIVTLSSYSLILPKSAILIQVKFNLCLHHDSAGTL